MSAAVQQASAGATVLRVNGLVVHYGAIQALRGISLAVEAGQVVALIGANGAGKTTTLRAVSRMLKPTAGSPTRPRGAASSST